jgi:uncharacterized Tic20 family protein
LHIGKKTNSIYQPGARKPMDFLNFTLFVTAAIGLSHIIADSSIISPVKVWLSNKGWTKIVDMMNCYQCNGFWSGVFIYMLYLASPYLNLLVWAFAISLVSPLVGYVKLMLEMKITPDETHDE